MNEEWPTNPKEPEIDEVFEYCGELEIKLAAQRIRIAELAAAESLVRELARVIKEFRMWHSPHIECNGCQLCAQVDEFLSRIPAHLRAPETTSTGESSTVLRQEGKL